VADIDRLLRDTLHDEADRAPGGQLLLAGVHSRSRQLRVRRRAATAVASVAASLAVVIPVAVAGASGGRQDTPAVQQGSVTAAVSPLATGAGSALQPGQSGSGAGSAGGSPSTSPTQGAIRFAAPTTGPLAIPFQLSATVSTAFVAPVVTLSHGALMAYYEAKDPVGDADTTLVVTGQRPTFAAANGPVTETQQRVRGHAAIMRTVAVSPAKQLILYWQESATQWIQLQTDDTYSDSAVIGFANGIVGTGAAVVVPFQVDLVPVGAVVDTQTPSVLAFRPAQAAAGSVATVTCTLVRARALSGQTVPVGTYRGTVTRGGGGVVLTVLLSDWRMTLLVEVQGKDAIADADLIRFGAGLHVTERAEPSGS
jgi:hypothetical protein